MNTLMSELASALRSIRRHPGHAIAVVVLLASGLTVALLMFEGFNGYILKPIPVPEPDRLMHMRLANPREGIDHQSVALHDFLDWRAQQKSFEDLAAFYTGTVNVGGIERPQRFDGAFVTASFFELMRARPDLGRPITTDDLAPGAAPVIVLGHGAWVRSFGADPDVIGSSVRVNGRASTVIGVMPEGFTLPETEEVWVPLSVDTSELQRGEGMGLDVIGRLRPGVSGGQGRAEIATIVERLAREYPESNAGTVAVVVSYANQLIDMQTRLTVSSMFISAVLVLLIACANVANLILARMSARTRELAVRASLGASAWRLGLPVVVECLILSVAATAIGLLLSRAAADAVMRTLQATDATLYPWIRFDTDWRSLAFALVAALASTLFAGVIPALRLARRHPVVGLREGARGSVGSPLGRMSRWLVGVEVTLACVVILSAGLMARTAVNVQRVNLGANIEGVITGRVGLFEGDYPTDAGRVTFLEGLVDRIAEVPGVSAAALTTGLPGTYAYGMRYLSEGQEVEAGQRAPFAAYAVVTPGYFDLFDVPIREGRDISTSDRADSPPVVVVNALLAARIDPAGSSVIGRRLQVLRGEEGTWCTIVGVVGNVLQSRVDEQLDPTAYLPLAQNPVRFASFAARTLGDPASFAEVVQGAVHRADPNLPVYWLRTLTSVVAERLTLKRFLAALLGIFAGVGLLLAAAGLFAVLSAVVNERAREIGIRRALGAEAGHVLGLLARHGRWPLAVGILAGLALGQGPAQMLSDELVGVSALEPGALLWTGLAVLVFALLAGLLPALRCLRVDPATALRFE